MRLTLRTLLAYLDNTLEPQDAETLRAKLDESGFAAKLVQRIRDTLDRRDLPSPSPQAKGPVEDANVISEYLDSTLPSEQVAEIERACLDSDPHLAEAAACHQILTMVMGQKAEVSPELRARIYELPDRKIDEIVTGGSFSSLAIPEEDERGSLSSALPTSDLPDPPAEEPITPVGVGDSGVSDAPTRLREIEGAAARPFPLPSGATKSRSTAADSEIYGRSIRPSRIAPWLVSLGLAALLLFALTRIFQPLLQPKQVAVVDPNGGPDAPSVVENSAGESTPPNPPQGEPADDTSGDPQPEKSAAPSESTPNGSDDSTEATSSKTPGAVTTSPETDAAVAVTPVAPKPGNAEPGEPEPANTEPASTEPASTEPADTEPSSVKPDAASDKGAMNDGSPKGVPPPPAPMPPSARNASKDTVTPVPPPPPAKKDVVKDDVVKNAPAVAMPARPEMAKIVNDRSLVAALVGDQWLRLNKETSLVEGVEFVVAPTFRSRLTSGESEITVIGPAQAKWVVGENGQPKLLLSSGRLLVSALQPGAKLQVQLGDEEVEIGFADIDSVAAASVHHERSPGLDPLEQQSHVPVASVLSVQGAISLKEAGAERTLNTGERWVKRGFDDAVVALLESTPAWIKTPDPNHTTLESAARDGLLELLKREGSLVITLRESTTFRRAEVSALASQALLSMGHADVYFGGGGILSESKQRAYWPEHYKILMATVDRSVESAQQLRDSVNRMDSANGQELFRLLTGYSQKQLETGGDTELVELLDSPSMAVRVLALENLHKITGTTLYYRAEEENPTRRSSAIKKWVTRQRKGNIRWQE